LTSRDVLRAWNSIARGRRPSLSIEVTRECPLRCPGCYAYEDAHLGGGVTLRQLNDSRGDALVRGILELVDRERPVHVSLVGGDPLVRYREMEAVIPQLLDRNIHVQLVTSAFRPPHASWAGLKNFSLVVSIDGLAEHHDVRRAPATYDRILKNISGQDITVHCTVTAQMFARDGYLDEFLAFWTPRAEVRRVWFSLFTPQRGAVLAETLSAGQRERVVDELLALRVRYPKLDMGPGMIREFRTPPSSPADCIFAQVTDVVSADLRTRVAPCQFGGDPDCSQCGCVASMGLASIANHKLAGLIPLRPIFTVSLRAGTMARRFTGAPIPPTELSVQ
jgi:sulfatase maturation enzyme AslB (radical SAM superfamily)